MQVQASGSQPSRLLVAWALFVLIVSAAAVLYETAQASSASASVSSLRGTVADLQAGNTALEAEVAALASRTNYSTGADSVGIYSAASASVVTVQGAEISTVMTIFGPVNTVSTVLGSGFVVSYQGSHYIVTNYHVVDGVSNLTVTFSDGNSYPAATVGHDASSDLAVVRVSAPAAEFSPLTLATAAQGVSVGDPVYAIGNPYGLTGSMTFGIVSQTGRTITESTSSSSTVSIADTIQFSAPINPGNSGGPLLDTSGLVVGITTASVSGSSGLYFAIPSTTILRELSSLVSTGAYSKHPYLGVSGVDMTYQLALAAKVNATYGVLVQSVAGGSPAAAAGIQGGSKSVSIEGTAYKVGGDIIVSVNGTKVTGQDSLASYLERNAVSGQTVVLGVIRSGTATTVSVVLGEAPGS